MAGSSIPGAVTPPTGVVTTPARTPGTLGMNDHGDPNVTTLLGDTPGSLGAGDHADPTLKAAKLPNGTAVAAGSDGNAAKATCPPALAARTDGGKQDVDWSFIGEREGRKLDGYVPDADGSKSGVTVGTGVDLGARSGDDIDKLDITDDLKKKLKPYCGKQGKDATDYLKDNALTINDAEATSLDKAIKAPLMKTLVTDYNAAVDAANAKDSCTRVHFDMLPQSVQTAIASANFQYGSLASQTPNYWKQVTEQRWQDAADNLNSFGDNYKTRRKLEAGLVEDAIKAAPVAK